MWAFVIGPISNKYRETGMHEMANRERKKTIFTGISSCRAISIFNPIVSSFIYLFFLGIVIFKTAHHLQTRDLTLNPFTCSLSS